MDIDWTNPSQSDIELQATFTATGLMIETIFSMLLADRSRNDLDTLRRQLTNTVRLRLRGISKGVPVEAAIRTQDQTITYIEKMMDRIEVRLVKQGSLPPRTSPPPE